MNMRIALKALAIAIIGVMAVNSAALAQKDHKGGNHKKAGAFKRLDLTDDQKAQIKALRDAFKQQNEGTFQEIKALRDQMKDARENQDKERAKAIHEQIKSKMESLRPAKEELQRRIAAILTPEQRAELEKMKANHKEHRGEGRRGKGKRGGENQPDGSDID